MDENVNKQSFHKPLMPIYFLAGSFTLAFSGIYILVVPLSSLFWPGEPFHALEMGVLIASMFVPMSFAGLIFGRLIDQYNRVKIFFVVAMVRGISVFLLSFTRMGRGLESWAYFYVFTLIFAFFAGGNYPTVVSLAHDMVLKEKRSRFFGIYNLFRFGFQMSGFLFVGYLVQVGLWRWIFISIGTMILVAGTIMYLKIKEPRRGAQREELQEVIEKEIDYDYKMDKEHMKQTMLSKTNLIALIEGIFTSIYLGSLTILFLPYIQTSPHNISPFSTGVFLAIFGFSG